MSQLIEKHWSVITSDPIENGFGIAKVLKNWMKNNLK